MLGYEGDERQWQNARYRLHNFFVNLLTFSAVLKPIPHKANIPQYNFT